MSLARLHPTRASLLWYSLAALWGSSASVGALDWHSEEGFRWAGLAIEAAAKEGFSPVSAAQTGIGFANSINELSAAANRVLLNGSGVAAGDFNNDGWVDLYFCGLDPPNRLYQNLGHWRFRDVTASAGLAESRRHCRGAVFADLNGDGWQDLLVSTVGHGVRCYLNNRNGTFTDATESAGVGSRLGSTTLTLADIDGNGTLDLYVANNRSEDIRDRGRVELFMVNGQIVVPPTFQDRLLVVNGEVLEYGEPDQLFLNDGQGRFSAAPWTDGRFLDEAGRRLVKPPLDWGLTAAFHDLNDDGAPDLYVCNDFWTPDRVWLNDGRGSFRAIAPLALRCISGSSMGVDFTDLDRDGRVEFFVVDMLSRDLRLRKRQMLAQPQLASPIGVIDDRPQILRNTLFHNRGDGTFAEIANFSGVAASDWSWQPVFLDVDLDGYEDLLVSAGHAHDVQDLDAARAIRARQHSWEQFRDPAQRQKAFTEELMVHMRLYPRLEMPIFAFRNAGGLRFEERTETWGTASRAVHHGMALADLDNDGDLDLVVNNLGSPAGVYRNDSSAPRVAVRLRGLPPNTQGIGAKVTLLGGAVPEQTKEVSAGGKYLSGSDTLVVFAAGSAGKPLTLRVNWRSGRQSQIAGVQPNRLYEIDEAGATAGASRLQATAASPATQANSSVAPSPPLAAPPAPLFDDVSHLLNHTHHEEPFDDFARQSLLPRRLSQLGPGAAWFDVDADGWEDLLLGSGRGGQLAVFINDKKGGFVPRREPPFTAAVTRDQTGLVAWQPSPGRVVIATGSANYEDGLETGAPVRFYDVAAKRLDDRLPGQASSTGPLALADYDADGDLDLFLGGRVLPGRYPEAASSQLWRATQGGWELDAENSKTLTGVGLVSSAVWSDLDGDGGPDLILACEWGPVRVFRNRAGRLEPWDAAITTHASPDTARSAPPDPGPSSFSQLTGWWISVTTGDFDADGRPDILAGNWGLNSSYGQPSLRRPIRLYYGAFSGGTSYELIEAEFDEGHRDFAPRRRLDTLSRALPFLLERFPSFRAFSEATVKSVLGELAAEARFMEATTLATSLWLNRGDHFETRDLPAEAQFSPAFGLCVADFDGDGDDDVFLAQNFFANEPETPRLDAGRGLLLENNGRADFRAVPGQESGVRVYGEQRGAACADFDHDGRVDLVVTQNGAPTRLLRNARATPGVRVRLRGPTGNPDAVGAALRWLAPGQAGPLREIQAGSGYWSQNSGVQVMAIPGSAVRLWIRWPGGTVTETALPASSREVTVNQDGRVVE